MPTDWIETGYAAIVVALKAGPFGPLVRIANLLSFDGPNPFPQTAVRAPADAVRLIVDLGEFRDVGQFGIQPTAGNCAILDQFSQAYTLKLIGPDKRSKPISQATIALHASLFPPNLSLPQGCIRGPLALARMPVGSPEFNGSDLRGVAGSVSLSFTIPLSLE